MAGSGIHDEVDSRQRETVFWAYSVDVSEVDADSPLVVLFFDKYDVGQPLGIFHLSDCSCLDEFADLLVDRFLPFYREAPPLLFDWLEGWADIQPMITVGSIPPMSARFNSKTSLFCLKKWVRGLLRSSASLELM